MAAPISSGCGVAFVLALLLGVAGAVFGALKAERQIMSDLRKGLREPPEREDPPDPDPT